MKILLTTTSFQDTPGKHQALLEEQDFDIDKKRGPLKENELLPIIGQYDAVLCGDDEYTERVLEKGAGRNLKYISKYGVGLDKIDLEAAENLGIEVTNCPGVNSRSVAEHVVAIMLCFYRNIHLEYNITKAGKWKRYVGHEVKDKTIALLGLGSVGKDTARLMDAFGLRVKAYDKKIDHDFVDELGIEISDSLLELLRGSDILSLHLPLTEKTEGIVSMDMLRESNSSSLLVINTARAGLIDFQTIKKGLDEGLLMGYCTDVMDEEPMPKNHPLKELDNVLITPHIGSRTYQSVERQGLMAVRNLLDMINNT